MSDPATIRAADVIAYARALAPTIEYLHSAQGADADHDGLREADCVGFVNLILGHFGVRTALVGSTLPWKVRWYFDHWRSWIDRPTTPPNPGDLLIIGDPTATISDVVFRHIGMATNPGHYISSLGILPGHDAKETAIPTAAHDRVAWILRTGFIQTPRPTEVDMATAFTGEATVTLANSTQGITRIPFPEGRFTEPPVVVAGLIVPVQGAWQKTIVRASSIGVTTTGVDIVVNTADGSRVTCTVRVPIVAFEAVPPAA